MTSENPAYRNLRNTSGWQGRLREKQWSLRRRRGLWHDLFLYTFANGADGSLLDVIAPLFRRGSALYGIASGGSDACRQEGCGSVFRLTPPQSGSGSWTETPLFDFTGTATGGEPDWIVGSDSGKTLYVATAYGNGSVVEIAPAKGGTWSETVLTTFAGGKDGSGPSNLVPAADGTIYGTAGSPRGGIVFQLAFANRALWNPALLSLRSRVRCGEVANVNSAAGKALPAAEFPSPNSSLLKLPWVGRFRRHPIRSRARRHDSVARYPMACRRLCCTHCC